MALKDLVAHKAALTEEAIEKIVANYVRYDTSVGEIHFTPDGVALKNDKKVLVYLTAILGWPHVTDDTPEVTTKPADLEKALGIPGGTLRPLLKTLKDGHLIGANKGSYAVRPANLDAIGAIVRGDIKRAAAKRAGKTKVSPGGKEKAAPKKKISGQLTAKITSWIKGGYFDKSRSLKEVHQRLHEQGVIVPQTSVSGPLLRGVQDGFLVRKKQEVEGKEVWTYSAASGT